MDGTAIERRLWDSRGLDSIETYVQELKVLSRPESVHTDVRELRFEAHTFQLAMQAVLSVAEDIGSNERLGEPNQDLFDTLRRSGWIGRDLSQALARMAKFRDTVVYEYEVVDPAVLEDITRHHLDDLLAFVRAIRERLASG